MEELLCIGCGAKIQTEDKEQAGYTPKAALEKGLETGELYCQRCFRLRHYNEITDVHITDDEFLKLLTKLGIVMHLWLTLWISLILMGQLSQVCHVLYLAMMFFLSEIKKTFCQNLLRQVKSLNG